MKRINCRNEVAHHLRSAANCAKLAHHLSDKQVERSRLAQLSAQVDQHLPELLARIDREKSDNVRNN
jgi:hypothetical protein